MDPLTTFALAGNALQFLEIGASVVRKAVECYRTGKDLPEGEEEVEKVAVHLHALSREIRTSSIPTNSNRTGLDSAVCKANDECLRLTDDFLAFLDKVKITGSKSIWKGLKLAVKQQWHKSYVQDLGRRVDHARANLTLPYLARLQADTSRGRTDITKTLNTTESRVLTEMRQGLNTLGTEISALADQLTATALDDAQNTQALGVFREAHKTTLDSLSLRIETLLNSQDSGLATVASAVSRLLSRHDALERQEEHRRRQEMRSRYIAPSY